MSSGRSALIAAVLSLNACASALAQGLPSEPVTFASGHVVLGGDVGIAIAPHDPGFFNYGSYEHNTLREFRIGVSAEVRATDRVSFLAQVRSENFDDVTPFGAYFRIRPFPRKRFDIQVGRIPPTFGRASRLTYARDNPLIGQPLVYQYLTSLRPDALPASADELLTMRGRGWLSSYTVGNLTPHAGVPLAAAFSWDTGIQATTGWRAVTVTGAVTNGTISNPRVRDDNNGKQVVMRVTLRAAPALELGTSFARGSFVSRSALHGVELDDGNSYVQQAYGVDAEYGRGHLLTRAEVVASDWMVPLAGSRIPLKALGGALEMRYALFPGMYVAGRVEHLTFNSIQGSSSYRPWDAPVTRIELGGGYYLRRNLVARVSWQANERDTTRVSSARFFAAQLLFWL
jgi:hypothetical protein